MSSGLFDIRNADDFFRVIMRSLDSYRSTNIKREEDLLLVTLGLSHLSDWIAPGYNPKKKAPQGIAQEFVKRLSENAAYRDVRELANHGKHQGWELNETQTTELSNLWDDRLAPIDTWKGVDGELASVHRFGERRLLDVFETVAQFYQDHWFGLPIEQRQSDAAGIIAENGEPGSA